MLDRLGEAFNQISIPLRYTPRRVVVDPTHRKLIVIETDHNAYSVDELKNIRQELSQLDAVRLLVTCFTCLFECTEGVIL